MLDGKLPDTTHAPLGSGLRRNDGIPLKPTRGEGIFGNLSLKGERGNLYLLGSVATAEPGVVR